MDYKTEPKKVGKKPMTEKEKEARATMLKNEGIESRTKRVLNPRLKHLFKQFDALISCVNSPRYKITVDQSKLIMGELEKRAIALKSSFDKTGKAEVKDIL
jgi:translation initiation factor 2 alpha subunit (eIF-2alpha)